MNKVDQSKNLEYLGKSNGTTLIKHSELVSVFSESIAEMCLPNFPDKKKLVEIACAAGFTHDIAKVIEEYQQSLKKNKKLSKTPWGHNQIAWSILSLRTNFGEKHELLLNPVYWHHAVLNNPKKQIYDRTIYDSLRESDIENILNFIKQKYPITDLRNGRRLAPSFFKNTDEGNNRQENAEALFIRSCVISADRIVSSFSPEEIKTFFINGTLIDQPKIFDYLNSLVQLSVKYDTIPYPYEMNDRLKEQLRISEINNNTVVVNAPAGLGKTFIGLYQTIVSGKKVIWVCPRNTVARAVYKNILSELKLWDKNLTVELFLTGAVEESNNNSKGFDSDIIVTNIDNFLSPTINHRHSDRLFLLHKATVVFDEYHEFIAKDRALFAGFITIMTSRVTLTDSKTILLSATPVNIADYWNTQKLNTVVLPEFGQHFSAPHTKKYKINICDESVLSQVAPNSCSLVIFNSVKSTQDFVESNPESILYHGQFTEEYKRTTLEFLLNQYGKKSERTKSKKNVISNHALQASLDVSFSKLYESVISPLATLQRVGRIDRWGDFTENCELNFFFSTSRNETSAVGELYDRNIAKSWFNKLKEYSGQLLSLDDLYKIYNEFNKEFEKEISNHIDSCFLSSLNSFGKLYPQAFDGDNEEQSDVITAGSNKLRSTGSEFFYIIREKGSNDKWVGPFTDFLRPHEEFGSKFEEGPSQTTAMGRIHKLLVNDTHFDFASIIDIKKPNIDILRKMAKKSNTPYVVFNRVYDPKLGIIKI